MTVQKRRKSPPVAAIPKEDLADLREGNRRAAEARHSAADREAVRLAIEATVERAVGRLSANLSGAAVASSKPTDAPPWMKIAATGAGLLLTAALLIGGIWNFAIAPVVVRLSALETAKAESVQLVGRTDGRLQMLEGKLTELTAQINTATRIRDQQQQANTDRIRGLELSDQAGAQQVNALAQSLAGLVARMEEMLRRQERLENRLGSPGTRQGANEAPAVFAPPPSHI